MHLGVLPLVEARREHGACLNVVVDLLLNFRLRIVLVIAIRQLHPFFNNIYKCLDGVNINFLSCILWLHLYNWFHQIEEV